MSLGIAALIVTHPHKGRRRCAVPHPSGTDGQSETPRRRRGLGGEGDPVADYLALIALYGHHEAAHVCRGYAELHPISFRGADMYYV